MATTKKTSEIDTARQDELERTRLHNVTTNERPSDEQLRSVNSFDDAMRLAVALYGSVDTITDYELGNGFKLMGVKEKARLIGTSFIVLHYSFNDGDFGLFVSVALVTANNDRVILNDGSTGIKDQLLDIAKSGRYGGFVVPHGLRASEYDTCTECGKPRRKTEDTCPNLSCGDTSEKRARSATYYLDMSE